MVTTTVIEKRIEKLISRLITAKQDADKSLPPEKLRKLHKQLKRNQRKLKNMKIAIEKANPSPKEKPASGPVSEPPSEPAGRLCGVAFLKDYGALKQHTTS